MGHAQRQLFEMVEELPEVELAKIIDFAQSIKKKRIEKSASSKKHGNADFSYVQTLQTLIVSGLNY